MIDLQIEKVLNQIEDYRNFPIDVFPEQVTAYMYELRDKLGSNPNYMAGAFLTTAGVCIGRSKSLIIRNTWREWCVFWPLLIGERGSKKSPSTNPMMNPIFELDKEMYMNYKAKLKAHSEDVSENKPTQPRMYVGDATIEAYVQVHSQNLRGVAIIFDELKGLVSNSGKYNKGSDIEKYLSAFSYGNISSTRKGEGSSSILHSPYTNIFGGIQPNILSSLMTENLTESGFWDRFLLISGNFQTGKMTEEDACEVIANNYNNYMRGLFELVSETEFVKDNGDMHVDYYRMNPEASKCWFNYNSTIEDLISDFSDLPSGTKSAFSKLATYFGRFILLFHILDSSYTYPFQKLQTKEVQIESVEKAIRVVKYFMYQYELISKNVSAEKEAKNILQDTKGMSIQEKVKLLQSKDPAMSQRNIAKTFGISVGAVNKYLNS